MISSNGSNEEDTLRDYTGATTSGEDVATGGNVVFHFQGSTEASPDQKSPGEIKVTNHICMYICMYVCRYVHMYVHMYVCMHASMNHTCMYRCVYNTFVSIHTCNICINNA